MPSNDACRICLEEGLNIKTMQPLFEEKDARCAEIIERIEVCGGILLKEHEDFPKMICSQCLDFLNTSYKFRNMCQASENALLHSIFKSEMKEEPQEPINNLVQQYSEKLLKIDKDSTEDVDPEEIYFHLNSDDMDGQEVNLSDISVQNKASCETEESEEFVAIEELDIDEVEGEEHLDDSDTDYNDDNNDSDDEFIPIQKKKLKIKPKVETNVKVLGKRGRPKISNDNAKDNTTTSKKPGRGRRKQETEPESNICEICGNIYSRRSLLNMHMRRHRAEKPFECEICGKTFTCPSEIGRHIRIHTGEKPYICRFCGRTFSDRSTNIKHERIHTNERPFICHTCGKSFMYSNVLKNHMLTHTGEKPFPCIPCNKTFSRKHQLEQHLGTITHHQTVKNLEITQSQAMSPSQEFTVQIADSQPHIVHT